MLDSLTMSPIAEEFETTRVLWQWRRWWGGYAKVVVASEHRCVGGDAAFHRSLPPLLYIYSAGDKTMVSRCFCCKFEPGPFTKVVRWCHGDGGAWYKPTCPYDTLLKSLTNFVCILLTCGFSHPVILSIFSKISSLIHPFLQVNN
jgi:hypothetical protein